MVVYTAPEFIEGGFTSRKRNYELKALCLGALN